MSPTMLAHAEAGSGAPTRPPKSASEQPVAELRVVPLRATWCRMQGAVTQAMRDIVEERQRRRRHHSARNAVDRLSAEPQE